jgi:hypothetical protein
MLPPSHLLDSLGQYATSALAQCAWELEPMVALRPKKSPPGLFTLAGCDIML